MSNVIISVNEAVSAQERHENICRLRKLAERTFLELGEQLYEFVKNRDFETLGYDTFNAYLADPEVDIKRSTAYSLMGIYETFIVELESPTVGLLAAGHGKLDVIRPYVDKSNVDRLVTEAGSISRSDLKARYGNSDQGINDSALMSSKSKEWYTPPEIIKSVEFVMGEIDTDPCAEPAKNIPALWHYTAADDGLSQEWQGRVYMNPPYGDEIGDWVDKAMLEYLRGHATEIIFLAPARPDTAWYRRFRDYPRCEIAGRLKFSGHKNSAPFPSVVFYIGPNADRFAYEFSELGDVYVRMVWDEAKVWEDE
jgi:hypothetical protein